MDIPKLARQVKETEKTGFRFVGAGQLFDNLGARGAHFTEIA
jgi:hypothetical protein